MNKHSHMIKAFDGTKQELAEKVGDLYYDSLQEFLDRLSCKLANDASADLERNRKQLAGHLISCSSHLEQAAREIEQAWVLCKPHVKE